MLIAGVVALIAGFVARRVALPGAMYYLTHRPPAKPRPQMRDTGAQVTR
ncbi:MAG TPA: hypothetical protein VMT58_08895 [Candidatus Binataceae bacterium]|nr:hypothetical protein [Candidatus Binataceae bacterium]